jgi:hypothetical protein
MLQNRATSQDNYERFAQRVKQSGVIWGLRSDRGWANCPSQDQEGRDVLLFWSDRAYAARQIQDAWSSYTPVSIPLDEFLARWLPGMHKDRVLLGPNWDAHLCGLEVEPLEVARDLGKT